MSNRLKRMVVTGREGQVVRSLLEQNEKAKEFEIITLSRPALDLSSLDTIEPELRRSQPDVIVSAAAYTAVDQAEADEGVATIANGLAPGKIASVAAQLGVPLLHLSTDYVFDGRKTDAYIEDDIVAPISAYGRSKLAGELAVADATANFAILRTAWVYSPFGKNFLKTILRLAESRNSLDIVDDQMGNPTSALDIADGILTVASNLLLSDAGVLRGIFHMTSKGEASWADFAIEILAQSALRRGPTAEVRRITSSQYPTLAKRPANSRLNCSKLQEIHGVNLPEWKRSVATAVARLAPTQN